jgi:hypothetical protein
MSYYSYIDSALLLTEAAELLIGRNKMLLTTLCKKDSSAYDELQNEECCFDSTGAIKTTSVKPAITASVKKYTYNNIPQTAEALVARLNKDIESLPSMTDAFGIEIRKNAIAKLQTFLTANNIPF